MAVMKNNMYQAFQMNKINMNTEASGASSENKKDGGPSMPVNNPYQQYQQNIVNTATPQELTLMLYNGMIKFLKLSAQSMDEKNIEKANNSIIRAQDIIYEFMSTLDMNYEVSKNLMALYDYMNRRLIEANLKKDKAIVEEVIGFAEELRDTWVQAMKLAKQQQVVNK